PSTCDARAAGDEAVSGDVPEVWRDRKAGKETLRPLSDGALPHEGAPGRTALRQIQWGDHSRRRASGEGNGGIGALVRLATGGLALSLTAPAPAARAGAGRAFSAPPAWRVPGPGAWVRTLESGDGGGCAKPYGLLVGWAAAG